MDATCWLWVKIRLVTLESEMQTIPMNGHHVGTRLLPNVRSKFQIYRHQRHVARTMGMAMAT
jgi:hypothetical protein